MADDDGHVGCAIINKERPEQRVSERVLNAQRELKSKSLAQKAALLKGKVGSVLAFGAGDNEFWLGRMLSEPEQWTAQSKQIGSGSSRWWLKKGDWFLSVMWFACKDEEQQHYVEEAAAQVLVESVVFTTEELCVTEQTMNAGRKRVTVLVLAPDSKRMIEDAGLKQFAVQ